MGDRRIGLLFLPRVLFLFLFLSGNASVCENISWVMPFDFYWYTYVLLPMTLVYLFAFDDL